MDMPPFDGRRRTAPQITSILIFGDTQSSKTLSSALSVSGLTRHTRTEHIHHIQIHDQEIYTRANRSRGRQYLLPSTPLPSPICQTATSITTCCSYRCTKSEQANASLAAKACTKR